MHPAGHGRAAHRTRRCYTGDAPRRLDHRFLCFKRRVASLSRLAQVHVGQHRALRLEAQRSVQRAHHAAHRHQRGRHQQRADGNLRAQQQVAQGKAAQVHGSCRSALHHLQRTALPRLPRRNQPKQQRAAQCQCKTCEVHARIHADHQMASSNGWPPVQHAQQQVRAHQPRCSADERDHQRLSQQLPDQPPAGSIPGPRGAPVPGCDPLRARQTGWPDLRRPPPAPAAPARSRSKEIRE